MNQKWGAEASVDIRWWPRQHCAELNVFRVALLTPIFSLVRSYHWVIHCFFWVWFCHNIDEIWIMLSQPLPYLGRVFLKTFLKIVYSITESHFPPFTPLHPAHPQFRSQSPWALRVCSLTNPFTFFQSVPTPLLPSDSCQSIPCIHASVSILFVSLFCSLDSTYNWDHIVFVFLWLAFFT